MSIYLVEFNIVGNTPEEFKTEFKELFKLDTVYIEFDAEHIGEVAVRLRYLFRTYQPKWYGIVNLSRFFRIYHEIEINGFTVRHLKKISEEELILILHYNVIVDKIRIL